MWLQCGHLASPDPLRSGAAPPYKNQSPPQSRGVTLRIPGNPGVASSCCDVGRTGRRLDHMTGAAVGSDDLIIEGVDNGDGRGLYTPNTVRRRLGAMTRLRSSSLILGDQPPIS